MAAASRKKTGPPLSQISALRSRLAEMESEKAAHEDAEKVRRRIFMAVIDAILVYDVETMRVVDFNEAALKMFGYTREDFLQKTVLQLSAEPEKTGPSFRRTARETVEIVPLRYYRRSDGSVFPVEISASILQLENKELLCAVYRDITERVNMERALHESKERYELAVRGANDGIWDWNLADGTVYYSPRWKSIIGCREDEIGAKIEEWMGRVHPEDLEYLMQKLKAHQDGLTQHFEVEHRIRRGDGRYIWVLNRGMAVFDDSRKAHRIAGSMADITDRKSLEQKLAYDAMHDKLTGLPNRALLQERMEQAFRRQNRDSGYCFAVVLFDLDGFKQINDSLGHGIGDQLLIAVARRVERQLRSVDTFSRLGGDEFVIILDGMNDPGRAQLVVERIRKELIRPFQIEGREVKCGASFGVAMNSRNFIGPESLLKKADAAMYDSKRMTHKNMASKRGLSGGKTSKHGTTKIG